VYPYNIVPAGETVTTSAANFDAKYGQRQLGGAAVEGVHPLTPLPKHTHQLVLTCVQAGFALRRNFPHIPQSHTGDALEGIGGASMQHAASQQSTARVAPQQLPTELLVQPLVASSGMPLPPTQWRPPACIQTTPCVAVSLPRPQRPTGPCWLSCWHRVGRAQGPYERLKRTVRERKSTMEEVTAAVHSLEPTACEKVEPLQALDGLLNKLHSLKRKVRPCAVFTRPAPKEIPIFSPTMHV
jgi:hypothetical protein